MEDLKKASTSAASSVAVSLMGSFMRYLGLHLCCTDYVTEMRKRVSQLTATACDMENKRVSYITSDRAVPYLVPSWLAQADDIIKDAEGITTGGNVFFDMLMSFCTRKQCSDIIDKIDKLEKQATDYIKWTGEKNLLGMAGKGKSTMTEDPEKVLKSNKKILRGSSSTSKAADDVTPLKKKIDSRQKIFDDALESLKNNETQKVALWGMGGVGKSTMMEELKKAVTRENTFKQVITVVVGQKSKPTAIQGDIAEYIGGRLDETAKTARADRLNQRFMNFLQDGSKILVILDDIWEKLDLKDIGLTTPLPKGIKLLLISREKDVCIQMDVKNSCIFRIDVLKEKEAKNLFWESAGIVSDGDIDHDLRVIGEEVIKRCGGLPIAIKIVASILNDNYIKDVWELILYRLKNKELPLLYTVFKVSYENLKEDEEKTIFLLSGLFPEDYNIPIEGLLRYGWGLELFKTSKTISTARRQVITIVNNLKRSNLLIESDRKGCFKMHDLVRDFVLSNFSSVKQASLVYSDDVSEQLKKESYDRILLNLTHTFGVPVDLKNQNPVFLKLLSGVGLPSFPVDLYKTMKKLEVVSYSGMYKPLLPRNLTTLRTLCLSSCTLVDDISFIGDLINLEVLSFVSCGISKLPSTIGKLEKLKLLDLTGCGRLSIGYDVFQRLGKLTELYLRVAKGKPNWKAINFTGNSCEGLEKISSKLTALEVEFFKNDLEPKKFSFTNLERFKISVGCQFEPSSKYKAYLDLFDNTLKLETSCEELLGCKINESFKKTERLVLSVSKMNYLEDISSRLSQNSFYNLRCLHVFKCADMRSIFTVNVAISLTKLEILWVYSCHDLRSLVHGENSGGKVIRFHMLKILDLKGLPRFVRLCDTGEVIELPQLVELILDDLPNVSIFPKNNNTSATTQPLLINTEVPKLEKLYIWKMKNLKEIWSCDNSSSEEEVDNISMLREIEVENCDNLANLFPINPMRLLGHLHKLKVGRCCSIEVLFNIDVRCVGKIENVSSTLRGIIDVWELNNLREMWRIKGDDECNSDFLIRGFQGIQSIGISHCRKLTNIMMPTTANVDLGALMHINIRACDWIINSQKQKINTEEISQEVDNNVIVAAFPSSLIHNLHQLPHITLNNIYGMEVVFDIKSLSTRNLVTTTSNQQPLLPPDCKLELQFMNRMTHLWKCNWNGSSILQIQQSHSLFQNLTTIYLTYCSSIKYLFSPPMAKLLSNLKNIHIGSCDGMEEVVSNRYDEDEELTTFTTTHTLFPHLERLVLLHLPRLKHVDGVFVKGTTDVIRDPPKVSQEGVFYWSLCQYARNITIWHGDALSSVIPSHVAGQTLKVEGLDIAGCIAMKEVFATTGFYTHSTNTDDGSGGTDDALAILKLGSITTHKLSNLNYVYIKDCDSLEYLFTLSTLESLTNLQRIAIIKCKAIKVIVRKETGDQTATSKVVVFPRLKSIKLANLPNLEGFFLGMNEFVWPLLDDFSIIGCPKTMSFTSSKSIAPNLMYIRSGYLRFTPQYGNSYVTITSPQSPSPSLDNPGNWSLYDAIEVNMQNNEYIEEVIFESYKLLHLQNLEKIDVEGCNSVKKVFEEFTDESEFSNKSQTVVKFPKLREVNLANLESLECIWKNNQWTKLEFPNLTSLYFGNCDSLRHVMTSSMIGSLLQLQELSITKCKNLRIIVMEESEEEEILFPCLKSLKLIHLSCLVGFYVGKGNVAFPSLDNMVIKECPDITSFTNGDVRAPELKVIETNSGSINIGMQDINSLVITKRQEGSHLNGSPSSTSDDKHSL